MRKRTLLTILFSLFLLLMIPHVSAIEYQKILETKESQIQNHIDTIQKKIDTEYFEKKEFSINNSRYHHTIQEIKDKLLNNSLKADSLQKILCLEDPGNGTDGNGPDDITDWIYFLIFIATLPFSLPFLIFDFFYILIMVLAVFGLVMPVVLSIVFFPVILGLYLEGYDFSKVKEFFGVYYQIINRILEWSPPHWVFIPFILIAETRDIADVDDDGR